MDCYEKQANPITAKESNALLFIPTKTNNLASDSPPTRFMLYNMTSIIWEGSHEERSCFHLGFLKPHSV